MCRSMYMKEEEVYLYALVVHVRVRITSLPVNVCIHIYFFNNCVISYVQRLRMHLL